MNILDFTFSPSLLTYGSFGALVAWLVAVWVYCSWADRLARQRYIAARERAIEDASVALVPKDLLTPNEREFFGRLESASAGLGLEVVPQVAMGALLDVNLDKTNPLYWPLRRTFDKKIIDFVVYEKRSMRVLTIVELDDRTHDPEKDRKRDAMMAKAGFRTIRWDSRRKPSVPMIRQAFADLLGTSAT